LRSAELLADALKLNVPKKEIPADRAFELIILESIGRKAAKTALDWKKNIADYIVACRQDGGLPFFRLTYAGQPLVTSDGRRVVLGVCLTATTSIMVDRFVYMPISKLYEKYISGRKINIMSYDFSRGAFIRTPILAAQKTKPNKILEIKLDKTKIKCSLDHPFFRKKQNGIELVNAADLNVGDFLPVLSNGDFYREFQIGGLFAGDGYIHRGREGYIKSISLSLLKEISAFLEEIGIKTTINPVPLCKGHFGKKPIYKLYIPRPKTRKEIEEIVQAHESNIKRALAGLVREGEILRIDKSLYVRSVKNATVKWEPIKEIKEKSGRYTYDFTTITGNFIANNIIVHNCWGGKGVVEGQYFVNVPEEDLERMERELGDWRWLIRKYGNPKQVRMAFEAPVIL